MADIKTKEICKEVAKATRTTIDHVKEIEWAMVNAILDHIANGESVEINDFAEFSASERSERKGRNPNTGEEITIAAKKVPVAKFRRYAKDKVNGIL